MKWPKKKNIKFQFSSYPYAVHNGGIKLIYVHAEKKLNFLLIYPIRTRGEAKGLSGHVR